MYEEITAEILNHLTVSQVDYGDVRIVSEKNEAITLSGNTPEEVRKGETLGFGVRVFKNGSWGFAASDIMNRRSAIETAQKALKVAQASTIASSGKDAYFPPEPVQDVYQTPFRKDPFDVSLEEKLELLLGCTEIMMKHKEIRIARAFYDSVRTEKYFASTTGAGIKQTILRCGGGIEAFAVNDGEVQSRSYPNTFRGNFATAGWEFIEGLDLAGNAEWTAEEAIMLLKAPLCPSSDTADLIIAPDQLTLQIHESIGHPIELDRIFGQEAGLAGKSFLSPEMLENFQYASPIVNVVADAQAPGGLGTFGYDDEGVPAQRFHIIKEGVLQDFLTSCGTAHLLPGQPRSNGCCRAMSWSNIPLIRMTNINLEPGEWDFNDLIQDTEKGFLIETNKSWSIDDKRLNFQFGVEAAREIKNGKIGRLFKNPVYTGITPKFWKSCDAVCSADWWQFYGTPNCGKGEPIQAMHVGHGAPPARFRNVKIGAAS